MSKKQIVPLDSIEEVVMDKVKSQKIAMKPKWYFTLGSLFVIAGFTGLLFGSVFLTNITLFLLRSHGPMGEWRLQQMLNSFPLWVPGLAVISTVLGVWLLKKYDFSYKRNFWLVIAGLVFSIILVAFVLENLGVNNIWLRKEHIRRFYQQINRSSPALEVSGRGRTQKFFR